MMAMMIKTPAELEVYGAEDCGLEMVHDMRGNDRNLLHTVAVAASNTLSLGLLADRGYAEAYGFRRGNQQWWTYTKNFPLSILEWVDTPDYRD